MTTYGYALGETCNRKGCTGKISEHEKEGSCACHINPPCSYCTQPSAFCHECGWDEALEQEERYKKDLQYRSLSGAHYDALHLEASKNLDMFYRKFRGEMPATELEIVSLGHTHFSMKKIGVFPKGSETIGSLYPKIKGTFGGRFLTGINKDSYSFEFIAYTD